MWKEQVVQPSPTLWEGEEQLKICRHHPEGPVWLPIDHFSSFKNATTGKLQYPHSCIECAEEARRKKDHKYNTSIRRKDTTKDRLERQPEEKILNSQVKFSSLPYTRQDLYEHLRNLYESWMTDENYGLGEGKWDVEHKIPRKFFINFITEPLSECLAWQKLQCLENIRPYDSLLNTAKNATLILPPGVTDPNVLHECTLVEFKELMKNWKD